MWCSVLSFKRLYYIYICLWVGLINGSAVCLRSKTLWAPRRCPIMPIIPWPVWIPRFQDQRSTAEESLANSAQTPGGWTNHQRFFRLQTILELDLDADAYAHWILMAGRKNFHKWHVCIRRILLDICLSGFSAETVSAKRSACSSPQPLVPVGEMLGFILQLGKVSDFQWISVSLIQDYFERPAFHRGTTVLTNIILAPHSFPCISSRGLRLNSSWSQSMRLWWAWKHWSPKLRRTTPICLLAQEAQHFKHWNIQLAQAYSDVVGHLWSRTFPKLCEMMSFEM